MISHELMLQFQWQEEKSHIKNHHLTFLIHLLATSPSTTKTINFSQTLEENNIDHKKNNILKINHESEGSFFLSENDD